MANLKSSLVLYGKHAEYANNLSKDRRSDRDGGLNIFDRLIDLVMIAAMIGLVHQRKEENDNSGFKATIPFETLMREEEHLDYIIDLISLVDDSQGYSNDKKLDITFRSSMDEENRKNKIALFKKYVNGGISYIHNYFNEELMNTDRTKIQRIITFYTDEI